MENKFSKHMIEKSNEELIEIITSLRNEYNPEAVIAAEEEVDSRNLSIEKIEEAKKKISDKVEDEKERQNYPLSIGMKFFFIFTAIWLFPWFTAFIYKEKGYNRKFKEALKFSAIGTLGYLVTLGAYLLYFYIVIH